MSALSDPFIPICVEARTRAMNEHDECPQLQIDRARRMYGEAASRYHNKADVGKIIHFVLNVNEPFESDGERYGYAVAIGLGFYRIRFKRESQLKEHERAHPLLPMEAYEQDM